jgi:hypothetical protein
MVLETREQLGAARAERVRRIRTLHDGDAGGHRFMHRAPQLAQALAKGGVAEAQHGANLTHSS